MKPSEAEKLIREIKECAKVAFVGVQWDGDHIVKWDDNKIAGILDALCAAPEPEPAMSFAKFYELAENCCTGKQMRFNPASDENESLQLFSLGSLRELYSRMTHSASKPGHSEDKRDMVSYEFYRAIKSNGELDFFNTGTEHAMSGVFRTQQQQGTR